MAFRMIQECQDRNSTYRFTKKPIGKDTSMSTKTELGGYSGKLLRVDLTNELVSEELLDKQTLRQYMGGTALAAKYLYDEVPAGVAWFRPGKTGSCFLAAR